MGYFFGRDTWSTKELEQELGANPDLSTYSGVEIMKPLSDPRFSLYRLRVSSTAIHRISQKLLTELHLILCRHSKYFFAILW